MDIQLQIQKSKQFKAFYLFFIIVSLEINVGMIGTPRIIFMEAGHDAWISLLIAYFYILLLLLAMLYILRQYENTDILGIQKDLFGTFVSKFIGTVYALYFIYHLLGMIMIYIEIVRVFVFPDMSKLIIGVMLLSLVVYGAIAELKVAIGICFLFMILSYWLLFLLAEPIQQMDLFNFLPIMDKGITDILRGVIASSYTFAGFEILFFIYPFILNKEKARKPVVLGFSFATFLIIGIMMISIGFFNPQQLERRIWPVLNLYKIQTSPIIERLDYIVVAEWMMVTVPKMVLLMWVITYIFKRIYNLPRKLSIYSIALILLAIIPLFKDHYELQAYIDFSRYIMYGLVYIYPFLLLPLVILKRKGQNNRGGNKLEQN